MFEQMSHEAPRCDVCRDVIGVYEAMVVRDGGEVRRTSRASELELAAAAGEHYHRACFDARLDAH